MAIVEQEVHPDPGNLVIHGNREWFCGEIYCPYKGIGGPKQVTIIRENGHQLVVPVRGCQGKKPLIMTDETGDGKCHPNGENFE